MRILVISDSHGRNDDIEGVLKQVGDIDMMIHCGDVERGDSYIREIADCPVVMVAGNNDYYLDLPSEEEVRIGDYKVLVTHGHGYYVNSGVDYLREHALEYGYDVVMYGHTHVPYIEISSYRYSTLLLTTLLLFLFQFFQSFIDHLFNVIVSMVILLQAQ